MLTFKCSQSAEHDKVKKKEKKVKIQFGRYIECNILGIQKHCTYGMQEISKLLWLYGQKLATWALQQRTNWIYFD